MSAAEAADDSAVTDRLDRIERLIRREGSVTTTSDEGGSGGN